MSFQYKWAAIKCEQQFQSEKNAIEQNQYWVVLRPSKFVVSLFISEGSQAASVCDPSDIALRYKLI